MSKDTYCTTEPNVFPYFIYFPAKKAATII